MLMQDSPRHGFVLHFRVCLSDPTQYFPPYPGGGLVHVRLRYCDPVPHVLEHWHHFPQGLHPPSALKREKTRLSSIRLDCTCVSKFSSYLAFQTIPHRQIKLKDASSCLRTWHV